MKGRKGFTLIELLVVIAIIAVLAAILFPVFAKARKAAILSDCQSNMKQIGTAFKMYLSDWTDTYPTNKAFNTSTGGMATVFSTDVKLTPPGMTTGTGVPARFLNGVGWVEELLPYVESVSKGGQAVWRCQAASNKQVPAGDACVSYAMNSYMCELPEGMIKGAANLMLVREMPFLVNQVLRPLPDNSGGTSVPQSSFLDTNDEAWIYGSTGKTEPKMHNNGSVLLFSDGHVKYYSTSAMPNDATMSSQKNFDTDTQQWFNFGPGATCTPSLKRSIAITP